MLLVLFYLRFAVHQIETGRRVVFQVTGQHPRTHRIQAGTGCIVSGFLAAGELGAAKKIPP
jgi:hypothetical protein